MSNEGISVIIGIIIGFCTGSLYWVSTLGADAKLLNNELIERGIKSYHQTTGKLEWVDK